MKNIFKINIFTYFFFLLSIFAGYFRELLIIYFIIIIHEMGHALLMNLFKIKVKNITLYPYGGTIKSDILINTNSKKVIIISLGGILIQIILLILNYTLFKLGLVSEYYYELFFKSNIYIMIFNIIPIYPLDGFKIVNSVFELIFPYKKSIYLSLVLNVICLILLIIYLYLFKISNYIIVMFLITSLIEYIKNINYIINKFYLERIIYDLKFDGLVSIKNKKYMYKNKKNYINGIDEKKALIMFDIA